MAERKSVMPLRITIHDVELDSLWNLFDDIQTTIEASDIKYSLGKDIDKYCKEGKELIDKVKEG